MKGFFLTQLGFFIGGIIAYGFGTNKSICIITHITLTAGYIVGKIDKT